MGLWNEDLSVPEDWHLKILDYLNDRILEIHDERIGPATNRMVKSSLKRKRKGFETVFALVF
jgi:hypothetical protein